MSKRDRRGRPRLPASEQSKPLKVGLKPLERELLDRVAAEAGAPTSAWAREVLLEHARRLSAGRLVDG